MTDDAWMMTPWGDAQVGQRAQATMRTLFGPRLSEEPVDYRALCDHAAAVLVKHSIVEQYARLMRDQTRMHRKTEPWMALGEKLVTAWTVFSRRARLFRDDTVHPEVRLDQMYWALGFQLTMATPFLWSSAIDDVVSACPLPSHVIGRDLLTEPQMFWSLDKDGTRPGDLLNWMLLYDSPEYCTLHYGLYNDEHPRPLRVITSRLPYGRRFPQDMDPQDVSTMTPLLQRLGFLRSPFVETNRQQLPRPWRRAAERAHEPLSNDEISVVRLRRVASQALREEHEARTVAWKHRWWVSAHYRAQWYPSKQAHEVIWIAPYLKGPPEAPFAERIYSVER